MAEFDDGADRYAGATQPPSNDMNFTTDTQRSDERTYDRRDRSASPRGDREERNRSRSPNGRDRA